MIVSMLQQQQGAVRGPLATWNPDHPAIRQTIGAPDSWTCAPTSFAWLVSSLGHPMTEAEAVAYLGPGRVNAQSGLLDGSGAALVEPLAALGFRARAQWATFDDILAVAGVKPTIKGGSNWYHWVGVRGRDGGDIRLMNPAGCYRGVCDILPRAPALALGPWALVTVDLDVRDIPSDADRIAALVDADPNGVRMSVPYLKAAMAEYGLGGDRAAFIAVLATTRVETGYSFLPIPEYATGWAYDPSVDPELARDLGNVYVGDGPRFKGAGYVQLTGRANYRDAGAALGLPLETNPDLALEPQHAARIMLWYFTKRRDIPALARAGDWQGVRRAVNGGLNGYYDVFYPAVQALQAGL